MHGDLLISSKVSPKGLTTIPSEIRKLLNIKIGDTLVWNVEKCHNEENVIHIHLLQDPLLLLKGRRSDPHLTYDAVEHSADKILEKETKRD